MPFNVHATALVAGTTGLILLGPSGIGKSSMALRLIAAARRAGHFATLVSDDQVILESSNDRIIASAPATIRGLIELRGSGIGQLDMIENAVLRLALELVIPDASTRIPQENQRWSPFAGVDCPLYQLDRAAPEPFLLLQALIPGFPVWR
ncbi:HPr kinase/phosphatase C-terminal domain-containing protein [Rhizobium sp. KVB221]|uniref:HPr kinase/phosphatase C-terminal domain-containing protein n=1 Tax=Rhizobium setariae TaxID=2801340 RepID=A0A936YPA8_9HYPH|nr:HPr kinase/phosphatase C-terminal domain-containing protein [Rhizobium setariae]MBL0374185.1 HPr kinase/phosphatase C-terminal domain-containing protein [Rhizobium setariae]